jgi:hypothetical protein
MVLKFLDKPFVARNPRGAENIAARAPAGSLPISTAPENGAFVAVTADGKQSWAVRHRGTVQAYKPTSQDSRGNRRWSMAGAIPDAVWWMPPRGR